MSALSIGGRILMTRAITSHATAVKEMGL